MSRRSRQSAEQVAQQASDAARVLQERSQQARQQQAAEPAAEPEGRGRDGPPVISVRARNEPRERAMAEIEERHARTSGHSEPEPEPKAEPEPAQKPEKKAEAPVQDPSPPSAEDMLHGSKFAQPEQKDEEQGAPAAEPAPEPLKTVRVKVDGQEYDAPAEEVEAAGGVRSYQIQKAAENRLEKANTQLAEVRKLQAEIAEQAAAHLKATTPQAPSDQEFIAQKLEQIRFGTPEEGAAALQEVLGRTNKQADPEQLFQQVMSQINRTTALKEFDREHQDIVSNPHLLQWAGMLFQHAEASARVSREPLDYPKLLRTIGNQIRSAVGKPNQPAAAPAATSGTPSQATSEKEARKASIVTLPTAAARAEPPKESKPETREDTLNEMRRSRGIPTG